MTSEELNNIETLVNRIKFSQSGESATPGAVRASVSDIKHALQAIVEILKKELPRE